MTQQDCLISAHHWTHMGVCYPGSNATIQLHSADPPPHCNVAEPSTSALFAGAMLVAVLLRKVSHHA